MDQRFETALRGLNETIRQIENLLAWRELERSQLELGDPTSFQFHSTTEHELKIEGGVFFKSYCEILEAAKSLPAAEADRVRRRLSKTFERFQKLAVRADLPVV